MSPMTSLKGYKTILFNGLITGGVILDYFVNNGSALGSLIGDPQKAATTLTILTVANLILRSVTNTGVGGKIPASPADEQQVTVAAPLPKPDGEGQ